MTTSALPRARPAKKIVQKMLRLCGVTRFVRFIHRHDAAIAVYHDPKPEVFDLHLRYLGRRFNFTTLDAIVDALLSDDWSQLPERALAVTIDDGHRGNHALLP